jgi:hypothetical protein
MTQVRRARAKAIASLRSLNAQDIAEESFGTPKSSEVTEKKVDEFGRDIDYVADQGKVKRQQIREAANKRRDIRRAARAANGDDEPDGWDTDDDQDIGPQYHQQRQDVLRDAPTIFSDADEQFQTFYHLQSLLQQWKNRYEQAYKDAYISLSVASLFAPVSFAHWPKWRYDSNRLCHLCDIIVYQIGIVTLGSNSIATI